MGWMRPWAVTGGAFATSSMPSSSIGGRSSSAMVGHLAGSRWGSPREGRARRSDVDEADVFGVLLDEVLPGFDVVAHERGDGRVSGGGLLDGDLEEGPR